MDNIHYFQLANRITMHETITVETLIHAPILKVWNDFTNPDAVTGWNFASDDWICPHAETDLRIGGSFSARMEAKDGSVGFDFSGTYTKLIPYELIEYVMEDGRKVRIVFEATDDGMTRVVETFDPEIENTPELQRTGWQAILNNFKKYSETEGQ